MARHPQAAPDSVPVPASKRLTLTLSVKLTTAETFALGTLLAVLYGVQVNLSMSQHAHDAITIAILLVGSQVAPITPAQFLSKIPPQIIHLIQAGIGALAILQQSFSVGTVGGTIIGVISVIAITLGLGPAVVPPIKPAKAGAATH